MIAFNGIAMLRPAVQDLMDRMPGAETVEAVRRAADPEPEPMGAACAREYASRGIRMNNVLPGFIESYAVDEVARTVAFLLSTDAGYKTGQSIRVDGGLTRSL